MIAGQPKVGETGHYRAHDDDAPVSFKVTSVEGNLCYAEYDNGTRGPFIWRHGDDGSLNTMHFWPSKTGVA